MRLDRFDNSSFDRGKPLLVEASWNLVQAILFASFLPGSAWRAFLLRLFGATIGENVVIKTRVRVKFPWKLEVGSHSWIGEGVWVDNLAHVSIGAHCCISQGVYLCTGNHRWEKDSFDLEVKPITIQDHCWLGARSSVAPGLACGEGSVLTLGSVAIADLEPWSINTGNPSVRLKARPRTDTS